LHACIGAESSDGIQQLHTVSKRGDAKLLQVLVRQARENRLVYVILAEDRLVLAEAKAPQPDHDVHDRPQAQGCCISSCGLGSVSIRSRSGSIGRSVSIGATIKTVSRRWCQSVSSR
jgi:hypothetical protein